MFPLISLILMTAYGRENIKSFIYVGFDSYYEKELEGYDEEIKLLEDTIKAARSNSQRRIKSNFSDEELKKEHKRLDLMEEAFVKFPQARNVLHNAIYVGLREQELKFEDFKTDFSTIINNRNTKGYLYEGKYKIFSNTTISTWLKVFERKKSIKRFVAEEPALKVRQLLKEKPNKWTNIRKRHQTLLTFIKDFNLEDL